MKTLFYLRKEQKMVTNWMRNCEIPKKNNFISKILGSKRAQCVPATEGRWQRILGIRLELQRMVGIGRLMHALHFVNQVGVSVLHYPYRRENKD